MRIVWSTLWFLDYRIPVFKALSQIEDVDFYLAYSADANSNKINEKIKAALGDRAIPMVGEKYFGKSEFDGFANQGFRIPYQPGLIKTIKALRPDVLVSDGFFQWTYSTLFLRATKGIPHVMCYERTMHTERNAQYIRTLYRKIALRWIDVVCCSGSLCQEYVRFLGFKKPLTKGFMVADTEAFKEHLNRINVTNIRNKEDEKSIVNYLFVGQLIERKGVIQLMNVWRKFQSDNKRIKLTIIGKGELDDFIRHEITKHDLDTVDFRGGVDYDDIPKYYLNAEVFILPTLEDNWSLVVPEAMASGLPIITTLYNGCYPELVTKENGWVMDALDEDNFLDILKASFRARSKYSEMGERSIEILKSHTAYTAAHTIYESCLLAQNKNNT